METASRLSRSQADVRQVAEAIASVLSMEVTIVDESLRRIAGTGCCAYTIGDQLGQNSAFARVLREGRGLVITNPREHSACSTCGSKQDCRERAEVCCPIILDNRTIGLIALIAFDERQRGSLLVQQEGLLDFLQRMADLLASKIAERERVLQLKMVQQQMATVLNTVQEGIIAVDREGRVVTLNRAASQMLHIRYREAMGAEFSRLVSGLSLEPVLKAGRDLINREVSRQVKGRRINFFATVKPWLDGIEVRGAVATLRELSEVRQLLSHFTAQDKCYTFDMIIGNSAALKRVKQEAAQAAAGNATVLIQGESGTGKELFARALHCASDRCDKPFIAINCAAIPESLLESELFGYEEGAFTGARRGGKPGKFELADGGTIFLDEIGDMSLSLQAKLLRVLQERRIERVGGDEATSVDVRIITATHKDLETMVARNEFRPDLYYRVNVFPLQIPPLRQRSEDLPLLIQVFLSRYGKALGKNINEIENEAFDWLMRYEWPGNIRELENTIEYMVNVATGDKLALCHIPRRIRDKCPRPDEPAASSPAVMCLAELERTAIIDALGKFGTSVEAKGLAAQALGISKATLYRKLKEYGDFSK